jgi:hypothetical protein
MNRLARSPAPASTSYLAIPSWSGKSWTSIFRTALTARSFYSVFDTTNSRFGIAPTVYTNATTN